jgi:hypothetical protein
MKSLHLRPFDVFVIVISLIALFAAFWLAAVYVNPENPGDVPFLLRKDTYDTVLPFLLGTVAVGGFALAYSRVQNSRERMIEKRRVAKAALDRRIKRLEEIYETVLGFFQNVRLQRRRIRGVLVHGHSDGSWRMRRGLFEEILMGLNEAQLTGERIMRTLDFEHDALQGEAPATDEEIERIKKLHADLRSQIGGIQGILRNVLRTAEWQGVTQGTDNDEDLVDVPDGLIQFADPKTTGNLGFRKIGESFDAFAQNIIQRIRELESESNQYSTGNEA